MLTEVQKNSIGKFIVDQAPEAFLEQFVKLIDLYNTNKENLLKDMTNRDRFNTKINYINESYNTINLLSKYVAIASSESDGLEKLAIKSESSKQQQVQQQQPAKQEVKKDNREEDTFEFEIEEISDDGLQQAPQNNLLATKGAIKNKNDDKEAKLIKEINSWGIDKNSFSYKALIALKDINVPEDIANSTLNINTPLFYNTIVSKVGYITGKVNAVVSAAYYRAAAKANYKDSNIDSIKKAKSVSKEFLITELYKYINS